MINVILFIVAVVLLAIAIPIAILYTAYKSVTSLLGKIAQAIDISGNIILADPFNDLLIVGIGYKFGRKGETISSVLGKNKRDGTLKTPGKIIAAVLDFFDKNHCIKSIREFSHE